MKKRLCSAISIGVAATKTLSVNLGELADILQVAVPTLRSIIRAYPDLPVLERGDKARQWQFDPHAVHAFLTERKKAEADDRATRDDLLAQLVLPIGQVRGSVEHLPLNEQLAASKLRSLLRDEAIECSFLVRVTDLEAAFSKLEEGMRASNAELIERLCREHNLPDPVVASLRTKFASALDIFGRDVREFFANPRGRQTASLF